MRLYKTIEDIPSTGSPVVLTIGNFDGLHLGHQAVIQQARALADHHGGEAWLLTFHPHPCHVVAPERCQTPLTTRAQKEALLEATELDAAVFMPFEAEVADLEPEAFVDLISSCLPGLVAVVVGENWRFGRKAVGDFERLQALGAERGFEVEATKIVEWQGKRVSSTRIRAAVANGDIASVTAMLGRPHRVVGEVVRGRGIGRQQGFPTANIHCADEWGGLVLPPPGIYAVRSAVEEGHWGGAAYLNEHLIENHIIEVHYFDVDEDLYGRSFEVELLAQIRPDKHFDSPEELVAQIERDVAEARRLVASEA